jgi:hypothetical protein
MGLISESAFCQWGAKNRVSKTTFCVDCVCSIFSGSHNGFDMIPLLGNTVSAIRTSDFCSGVYVFISDGTTLITVIKLSGVVFWFCDVPVA